MRKKVLLLITGILCIVSIAKTQDLTLDSQVLGFNYDSSTGIISNMYFRVMNTDPYTDVSSTFDISIILSVSGDPYTYYIIDSYDLNSVPADSYVPISNWNIDLNNVSGLSSGDYRLGIWLDYNETITETNENNNYFYISSQGNDLSFTSTSSGIFKHNNTASITLNQNYPNPVKDLTTLSFIVEEAGPVNLSIYDNAGKLVKTVVNEELNAGEYSYMTDLSELKQGVYYYSLSANHTMQTKKLVIH